MTAAITAQAIGDVAQAIAVIFAGLIVIGSVVFIAVVVMRLRFQRHLPPLETLAGEAEADRRKTIINLRDKTFCI